MSISIRDLQQMSSAKIAALPGPTAIKAGDQVVALLTPLRAAPLSEKELAELDTVLGEAARLRAIRNNDAEEEAYLRSIGVDPTDWNDDAVENLLREDREPKPRREK